MSQPFRPEFENFPPEIKSTLFDAPTIAVRVGELAEEISSDYADKDPIVASILQGAVPFTRDLTEQLTIPVDSDSIRISRYHQESGSTEVCLTQDLCETISGRHVLLIEDIVDTGLSLNYLVQVLLERHPASLRVCTLLDRPDLRLVKIPIGYTGFQVDDEFIVGYGLDYRDQYRELPFLAVLDLQPGGITMDSDRLALKIGSQVGSIGLVPRPDSECKNSE